LQSFLYLHDINSGSGQFDFCVVLPLDGRVPDLPGFLDELVLADVRVGDVVVQRRALLLESLQFGFSDGELKL